MTVAVSGAPSPAASTQWPSARNRSLKASIAVISAVVALPLVSSITEIRYRIVHRLLGSGRAPWLASHHSDERVRTDRTPGPQDVPSPEQRASPRADRSPADPSPP